MGTYLRVLAARIVALFSQRRGHSELNDEIRTHLDLLAEEYVRRGMSPHDARAAARRDFGGVDQVKETYRDHRGIPLLDSLGQDLRYAFRSLLKNRGFAAVAILTLALGIGATTTLFGLTYNVLLKPLPWPDAHRLVSLSESRNRHSPRIAWTITNATFNAWHAQPATIEEIGGWRKVASTVAIAGSDVSRLQTAAVTPSLFGVLRARPWRGRLFVEDDGRPGGSFPSRDLIILSHGLWVERFGGRDDVIGSAVRVGDKSLTIVGVMPPEFAFPDRETRAWTPWAVPSVLADQGVRRVVIFRALARLRADATPAQASAEGTARARRAPDPGLAAVAMFGGNGPADISALPALDVMTADVKPALLVLLAAVALLLVTATANVASLQLVRATVRRREMAIRAAIGAGTGRLTRQLVVESSLVGGIGGGAGLALAVALHRALPSVLPADFPRVDSLAVDARIMLFTLSLSIVASVVCGLLPAFHVRRANLVELLSEDRGTPPGAGRRSSMARARATIMIGQVAVSCVLLVAAALLGRSFIALAGADRGYDPRNLLTARAQLSPGVTVERRTQSLEAVVNRLRPMPGVTEAAFANALPLLSSGGFRAFKMRPPIDPSTEVDVNAIQRAVSPGYFAALGLRLFAGRPFTGADTMTSPMVIVVNRSFAATYLGPNAVGAIVPNLGMCRGNDDRWEVVGIVEDVRQAGVSDPPQPEVFLPYRQVACPGALEDSIVVVRTTDDPGRYAAVLRDAVREQSPTAALDSVMTMEDRVMTSLAKPRLYAAVLSGFGLFALVIAGVGLFGVLSYTVAQRAREIGIRTALGARTAAIVGIVLRQALLIAVSGLTIGLCASFVLARYVTAFLYGISAHDTLTYAGVAAVLGMVAVVACLVPARRAAHVDPLVALRQD
jgi:predicted permease